MEDTRQGNEPRFPPPFSTYPPLCHLSVFAQGLCVYHALLHSVPLLPRYPVKPHPGYKEGNESRYELLVVAHACDPSTSEVGAGGLGVQRHPQLLS